MAPQPKKQRRKRKAENGEWIRKRVTKRWRPDTAANKEPMSRRQQMEMRRSKLDLSDDNTFIQEYNVFISKIPEPMHQRADGLFRKFEKYCREDDSGDLPPLPMNDALHFRVISAATKRCDISLYQVVPHAVSGGIPKAVQEGIASIPATLRVTLAHVILVQGLYEQSPLYAECSGFERLVMVYIRLLARNEGWRGRELRVKERERRKLNDKCKKNKDNKDDDFGGDFSSASASEEEDDDDDCYGARRDDFSYMNKERRRLQWIFNKKQLKRLQRRQQVARDLAARNKREREDRVRMLADRAKQRRVNDPTYVTLDRAVLAHCFDPDSGNVVCFTPVGRKGSCRRVERSRMAHCANPNVGDIHYVYQLNGRFEFTYATVHAMFNGLFSSEEHWLNPLLEMLPDEGYVSTFKALYRKMCVFAADNRSYMHMFWNWMAPSVNASIERARKMMDQQQSAVVAPSTTTEKIIANMTTKQVGCTFAAIAVHGADSYDACKETLLSKQHMTNPLIRRKHWEAVTKQFAPLLKRMNTYISYLCHRILNAQVELQDMANFGSMLLGGNSDAYTLPSPVGGSESVVYEQPGESETWMYEQFQALFPHQRDLDSKCYIVQDMRMFMYSYDLKMTSEGNVLELRSSGSTNNVATPIYDSDGEKRFGASVRDFIVSTYFGHRLYSDIVKQALFDSTRSTSLIKEVNERSTAEQCDEFYDTVRKHVLRTSMIVEPVRELYELDDAFCKAEMEVRHELTNPEDLEDECDDTDIPCECSPREDLQDVAKHLVSDPNFINDPKIHEKLLDVRWSVKDCRLIRKTNIAHVAAACQCISVKSIEVRDVTMLKFEATEKLQFRRLKSLVIANSAVTIGAIVNMCHSLTIDYFEMVDVPLFNCRFEKLFGEYAKYHLLVRFCTRHQFGKKVKSSLNENFKPRTASPQDPSQT
ncbi:hypothetical protein V5799_023231 [Amblyomma americanum]|uniref:Uncharacterized protein n=1 Tax=Amblyomma americanum TaxID=6943 RepID=A0AAQ4FJY7_AMBAM